MAFGFPPSSSDSIFILDDSKSYQMGIALAAFQKNSWNVIAIDEKAFYAFSNPIEQGIFSVILCEWKDKTLFLKSESGDGSLFDDDRNFEYLESFKSAFWELKDSGNEDDFVELYKAYKESIPTEELRLDDGKVNEENASALKDVLAFFIPRKDYFITPILININFFVFALMVFFGVSVMEPNSNDVFVWGGVFRPAVLDGEWYRIISAFFVHIGLVHLLMNMFALLMVGAQLELLLGKWRYLLAYIFCGIVASCASLWWHPATVGAGASGAIFGLYGLFLALLVSNLLDRRVRKPLLSSIGLFVVYNLAFGLNDGIDNAAHIGGLIAGIIAGYAYYFGLRFSTNTFYKWKLPAIIMSLYLILSLWFVSKLDNPYGRYEKLIYEFQYIEDNAIKAQEKIQGIDENQAIMVISTEIIPTWTKCNQITKELHELDLDKSLNKRNDLLYSYTQNRLMFFETMFKASNEKSRLYDAKIDSLSKSNETILQTIKGM